MANWSSTQPGQEAIRAIVRGERLIAAEIADRGIEISQEISVQVGPPR
jgi:hypothetical protein